MYRPQFAFSTPEFCRDEEFTYHFNTNNTPLLELTNTLFGSAFRIDNIPLILDQDAAFYWRGIKLSMRINLEGPDLYTWPNLSMKFQEPMELRDLSDGLIPATQYGFPMNPLNFGTAASAGLPLRASLLTGPPTPLDPEIYCPPGGVILLFLRLNPFTANSALLNVTLYGVKRFKECNP